MSKYAIKNVEGAQVAETELADSVFGIEPNISCIHQVVVCQDACKRQGTHSTKNRHDVSGGGAKPYRQKGTGRARQGSIRAGQWTGGGVIFGPTPHSHAKRVNHKMVKVAMRGVLSGKVADGELVLVDSLDSTPSALPASASPSSSTTRPLTPTSPSATSRRSPSSAFPRPTPATSSTTVPSS